MRPALNNVTRHDGPGDDAEPEQAEKAIDQLYLLIEVVPMDPIRERAKRPKGSVRGSC